MNTFKILRITTFTLYVVEVISSVVVWIAAYYSGQLMVYFLAVFTTWLMVFANLDEIKVTIGIGKIQIGITANGEPVTVPAKGYGQSIQTRFLDEMSSVEAKEGM